MPTTNSSLIKILFIIVKFIISLHISHKKPKKINKFLSYYEHDITTTPVPFHLPLYEEQKLHNSFHFSLHKLINCALYFLCRVYSQIHELLQG